MCATLPGLGENQTSVMFTFFPKVFYCYISIKDMPKKKEETPLSTTVLAFTVLEIFLVSFVSFTTWNQIMTRLMTGMQSLLFSQSPTSTKS